MAEILYQKEIHIDNMELLSEYDSKNKGYIIKYDNQEIKIGVKGFEEKLLPIFKKIGEVINFEHRKYKIIIKNKTLKLKHLYDKRKNTHTLEIKDKDNNLMLLTGEKLIEKILPLFKKFEVLNKDINEDNKVNNIEVNNIEKYSKDNKQKTTEDMQVNNSYITLPDNISLDGVNTETLGKVIVAGTLCSFIAFALFNEDIIKKVKDNKKIVVLGLLFLILVIFAYLLWKHYTEINNQNNNRDNYSVSKTSQYLHVIYDQYRYYW